MTGINDTDIRLTDDWQQTQAASGDSPLCSGIDCLRQNIAIEAATQPGDLFYDASFGWGLYDFINADDDDLTRLEIKQRVRNGLLKRDTIVPDSIGVALRRTDDKLVIDCTFSLVGAAGTTGLAIVIDPVSVEVI